MEGRMSKTRRWLRYLFAALATALMVAVPALAQAQKKPNILVIFGDDVGQTNISAYSIGVVGYKTPNIDRIAKEGMMFTDYYAENSCTAGRSSFITGQTPNAHRACRRSASRARRSACRRATSPSPRRSSRWAMRPASSARTISATATSTCRRTTASTSSSATSITSTPRRSPSGRTGRRMTRHSSRPTRRAACSTRFADGKIEDTGPLNRKRMETIDDETTAAAIDFMERQVKAEQAVLHLDEHHPHARLHPRARVDAGPERHARQRICRRHDRA